MDSPYHLVDSPTTRRSKCKVVSIALLISLLLIAVALIMTVALTPLHITAISTSSPTANLIQTVNQQGQYVLQPLIQKGDNISLQAHYRAGLAFMAYIEWEDNNSGNGKHEGDSITLLMQDFNSSLTVCRVVYKLFGRTVRTSQPFQYSLRYNNTNNDNGNGTMTSPSFLFYQSSVHDVPYTCIHACNLSQPSSMMTITLNTSSSLSPQCFSLQSVTVGSILMGDMDNMTLNACNHSALQHSVVSLAYKAGGIIILTLNSTIPTMNAVVADASFSNFPIFASLANTNNNNNNMEGKMTITDYDTFPDPQQTTSAILAQLIQLRKRSYYETLNNNDNDNRVGSMPEYSFDTGDRSFSPFPNVGIAFHARGSVSLNAAVSLEMQNNELTYYHVTWEPVIDLTCLGVIHATVSVDFSGFSVSLWEAPYLGVVKFFGIFWEPTFGFELSADLKVDGVFSLEMVAMVTLTGQFSVDYNPTTNSWQNMQWSAPQLTNNNFNVTPAFSGCKGSLELSVGPALGLKFSGILELSLGRKFAIGWQSATPAPLQPTGQNPGGPDANLGSNAFCNNVGCWCPTCAIGNTIPSLSGAYANAGWELALSLSYLTRFSYTPSFLQHLWITNYVSIGPQVCSNRTTACEYITPQRCPGYCPKDKCSADDCYFCPQPGLADCGPPDQKNSSQAIWCAQTYANGGVPYTKPPSCYYPFTCVVRCCSGEYWSQCYWSSSTLEQLCQEFP